MAGKRLLKKYDGKKQGWWNFWKAVFALALIFFILFRFVIGVSTVSGDSMLPGYEDGDIVVYSRIAGNYSTGDVVSARLSSGEYVIKRVVATGGDVVDISAGSLYICGEKAAEPYASGITQQQEGIVQYPYTVEEGYVFVLGDNREVSLDSRSYGEINESQIKGKVIFAF